MIFLVKIKDTENLEYLINNISDFNSINFNFSWELDMETIKNNLTVMFTDEKFKRIHGKIILEFISIRKINNLNEEILDHILKYY